MITKKKLKKLSMLKLKKYRKERGQIVVEGERLIDYLISNNITIEEIYYTKNFPIDKFQIMIPKYQLHELEMRKITTTKHIPPVSALVQFQKLALIRQNYLLYLDDISEPGNLGTIIRTAVAFGLDGIVLSPNSCDEFNPKCVRASLGTVFTIPIMRKDYDWLFSLQTEIIATSSHGNILLSDFSIPQESKTLVIGSEAHGISKKILDKADHIIKIPMFGNIESLNIAVATAICLYQMKIDENNR